MNKFASVLFLILATDTVCAFSPPSFARGSKFSTRVFSEAPEEEEGGLDLNLEEMFDMFDAADKDEDFDEALKKVKGSEGN